MSLKAIRDKFGIPAFQGRRVEIVMAGTWRMASILRSCEDFVVVKPDIRPSLRLKYHPDHANLIDFFPADRDEQSLEILKT